MAATTIPTAKQSINALLTTTADNYHKGGVVKDAIFNSNPLFHCLHGKEDGIREETTGGDMYTVGLMYEGNSTVRSYAGAEKLNTAPQDGMTKAYFARSQYSGAVTIDGLTRLKNRGKAQIQSIQREKTKQTTGQFAEKMNEHLFDISGLNATTGASGNDGKNINSLNYLIQDGEAGRAAWDVGGVDQSAETWWMNKEMQSAATTWAGLNDEFRKLSALCSLGSGGAPDIAVSDMWTYLVYVAGLDSKVRYNQTKDADMGFDHVMLGSAKYFWDGYVPDINAGTNGTPGTALTNGTMYMINSDNLFLKVESGLDFAPQGFRSPVDQDASTALYLFAGQLVTDNRKKLGLLWDTVPTIAA